MRARRRSGPSTTPVGNWCAGVSSAASRPGGRPAPSTSIPSASTATAGVRRPQCSSSSRVPCDPGSSTAMSRLPPVDEHLRRQRQRLRDARDHHDVVGLRPHATGPTEPARQLGAQPRMPLRVAVAERPAATSPSTARVQRSQAARGNADRSGSPGERSTRSDAGLRPPAAAAVGTWRGTAATRVPRAPSAHRAGPRRRVAGRPRRPRRATPPARPPSRAKAATGRRVASLPSPIAARSASVSQVARPPAGCVGRVELQEVDARHLVLSSGAILALSTGP